MIVLVCSNQDANSKRFKTGIYFLRKRINDNYSVIISRRDFYDQPIDSHIKRYEEIRK